MGFPILSIFCLHYDIDFTVLAIEFLVYRIVPYLIPGLPTLLFIIITSIQRIYFLLNSVFVNYEIVFPQCENLFSASINDFNIDNGKASIITDDN